MWKDEYSKFTGSDQGESNQKADSDELTIEELKYRLLDAEIALAEAEGRFVAKPHFRKAYKELKKLRKVNDRD